VAVATIPLAVFKTVDQPAVVSGNYTSAAFLLLQAVLAIVLAYRMHSKTQHEKQHGEAKSIESRDIDAEVALANEKAVLAKWDFISFSKVSTALVEQTGPVAKRVSKHSNIDLGFL
jgi:septal ring-binding cell division protein DamX